MEVSGWVGGWVGVVGVWGWKSGEGCAGKRRERLFSSSSFFPERLTPYDIREREPIYMIFSFFERKYNKKCTSSFNQVYSGRFDELFCSSFGLS